MWKGLSWMRGWLWAFLLVPALLLPGGPGWTEDAAPAADPELEALVERILEALEEFDAQPGKSEAPEFPGGKDWFNSPPLRFDRELRGKIVVLDFWTYCCINCIHVLPDLAYLEEKYAGHPVAFVGVHSAKFDNERLSENVRRAVLRYEIEHPVINDDDMTLWREYGATGWPTLAVVAPTRELLYRRSGEGQRRMIDALITAALRHYPPEAFRHDPIPMAFEREKREASSPLRFPGKLAVDAAGKRLFISDSNHNRIVVTDLDGRFLDAIGSGRPGFDDGSFESATFQRLQGVAYDEGRLFIADAENHALRRADLERRRVVTLAGDGTQGRDYRGGRAGREQPLSTPWDVVIHEGMLYVAMAGTHQIWTCDPETGRAECFSGTGEEANRNAPDRLAAAWAQPSGLAVGAGSLFVADSESSSVRAIDLESGASRPIAGGDPSRPRDLFEFGDRDGRGAEARLQHPLGIVWLPAGEKLLIADTYNHKLKLADPDGTVTSWAGSGAPGRADGARDEARFSEPSGIALGPDGKRAYIADASNHAIRVADLETGRITTLDLEGVPRPEPPSPRAERLADLPGTPVVRAGVLRVAPGAEGRLILRLELPEGHEYTEGAGSRWQVLAQPDPPLRVEETHARGRLEAAEEIAIPFRAADHEGSGAVRIEALAYYCESGGVCRVSAVVLELSVEVREGAAGKEAVLEHAFSDLSENLHRRLLPEGPPR